jgi:hypothetical protein
MEGATWARCGQRVGPRHARLRLCVSLVPAAPPFDLPPPHESVTMACHALKLLKRLKQHSLARRDVGGCHVPFAVSVQQPVGASAIFNGSE